MIEKNTLYSLDHMTHINNLNSILKYGLLSHNNPYKQVDISNFEVNSRREVREGVYGRKIHDYVPFYFNPRNAMMYRNKDLPVIILAFNSELIYQNNVLFTDKNAATYGVRFYNNKNDFNKIQWDIVQSNSWYNKDIIVKQTMMAEVLVYNQVPISHLEYIYVKNEYTKHFIVQNYNIPYKMVIVKPELFFIK